MHAIRDGTTRWTRKVFLEDTVGRRALTKRVSYYVAFYDSSQTREQTAPFGSVEGTAPGRLRDGARVDTEGRCEGPAGASQDLHPAEVSNAHGVSG